jgi:hypothetical protein
MKEIAACTSEFCNHNLHFFRDFVNYAFAAKNFKNVLKTMAVKNQKKLASRARNGLFSTPEFVFPGKCSTANERDCLMFSPLVKHGDQLCEKVVVKGTDYNVGHVVITKVHSSDVLQVGTILKVVMRQTSVLFLVELSEAARNKLGFFETLPSDTVELVDYNNLADYKPVIKRGSNKCYPFVLHHHVPTPLEK